MIRALRQQARRPGASSLCPRRWPLAMPIIALRPQSHGISHGRLLSTLPHQVYRRVFAAAPAPSIFLLLIYQAPKRPAERFRFSRLCRRDDIESLRSAAGYKTAAAGAMPLISIAGLLISAQYALGAVKIRRGRALKVESPADELTSVILYLTRRLIYGTRGAFSTPRPPRLAPSATYVSRFVYIRGAPSQERHLYRRQNSSPQSRGRPRCDIRDDHHQLISQMGATGHSSTGARQVPRHASTARRHARDDRERDDITIGHTMLAEAIIRRCQYNTPFLLSRKSLSLFVPHRHSGDAAMLQALHATA